MSDATPPDGLHEKIMEVVMNHGADAAGLNINLAETVDALTCALSWTLALSPDLTRRREIRQVAESISRALVDGVVDAQTFNREHGLSGAIQATRFQ